MNTNTSKGTALVTGASSGIGAIYADRLAGRGYDLILVARDLQRLDKLADTLGSKTGAKVTTVKADLTDKADLLRIEQILRTDATITMLVNNAGIASEGTLTTTHPDVLESIIQLNVTALTRLAAAAATGFVARKAGTLINIGSVTALMDSFNATYSATKAYVLSFSQTLHKELGAHGVQVQVVSPGVTRTEIWQRSGMDLAALPAAMVMDAGEMVDAALAGLDQGELVTIPSLPDAGDWSAYDAARGKLAPNLSHSSAAQRYKQ